MNQMRTIRLPIHIVKELNVYLRAERELSHKLDHDPSKKKLQSNLINLLIMSAVCYGLMNVSALLILLLEMRQKKDF